jgi:Fe-S-cluster containining protein
MILSQNDIELIIRNSTKKLRQKDFVLKNDKNQLQLRNIEGHCVFFDYNSKGCNIYKYRPHGCRFYPLIYDIIEEKCKLDEDCPRTSLFYKHEKEFKTSCENLKTFLKVQLKLKIN